MDLIRIRQALHAIPEIGLKEFKTARFLADQLKGLGLDVAPAIAGTGIVATLKRGDCGLRLGLRADMDALAITETGTHEYSSRHPGCMHACGHDGHMAMLLGAAHALVNDPAFKGTVHFIFQPAEENLAGAQLMIQEGLFEQFPCDMVFGLHNMPGLAPGTFAGKSGAFMASIDSAQIIVTGKGGHGAQPEKTVDPVLIGAHIVTALQSIVSRNIDPTRPAVVTVGAFHAGTCSNIIPDKAVLDAAFRTTDPGCRAQVLDQVKTLCTHTASGFGGSAAFKWDPGYPVLVNHKQPFDTACRVIRDNWGDPALDILKTPVMISEDFAFMAQAVPGAFVFIGNGDTAPLHTASYDFNDEIIPYGVKYLHSLAKAVCE